jgi:hypothetical protein
VNAPAKPAPIPVKERIPVIISMLLVLGGCGWCVYSQLSGYREFGRASSVSDPELKAAAKHFREVMLVRRDRDYEVKRVQKQLREQVAQAMQDEDWRTALSSVARAEKVAVGGPLPGESPEQYAAYLGSGREVARFKKELVDEHGAAWANYAECLADLYPYNPPCEMGPGSVGR